MSLKNHVLRLTIPVLALAFGACLALSGCGGGSSSPATAASGNASGRGGIFGAGGSTAGAGGNSACAAFATVYKQFLNGYAPKNGTDESPLLALSDAVDNITTADSPSGQLGTDLANLGVDAGLIATGSSEGGVKTPPSAFDSDLQAVGQDCGTTYTAPPASLVREE